MATTAQIQSSTVKSLQTRRIVIHLHNARDIKNTKSRRQRIPQSPFAHLAIFEPMTSLAHAKKSLVAHNQGVNPTWDTSFAITIDDYFLSTSALRDKVQLCVTIIAKNEFLPNWHIGHTRIPLANILESQTSYVTSYPLSKSTLECLGIYQLRPRCNGSDT